VQFIDLAAQQARIRPEIDRRINAATYNIDPQRIEPAITENTRAIMPVSLYGQCADYDTINEIAARHSLPVIEDGAQSLGATHNGRPSCGLTTIGCTTVSSRANRWVAMATAAPASRTTTPWRSACARSACTGRHGATITPASA
jgi:glutamate/tyrosine decarboxylase-like PLP-dependent enzyme